MSLVVPAFSAITAHTIASLAVTHLPPQSSARLPVLLLSNFFALYGVLQIGSSSQWAELYISYMLGYTFNAVYVLCLRRYASPTNLSPKDKFIWSLNAMFNPRALELSDGPTSSKPNTPEGERKKFIARRLKSAAFCLAARYILQNFTLEMYLDDIRPLRHSMLRRLASDFESREFVVRAYLAFYVIFIPYLELQLAHDLLSCLAVGLFKDQQPSAWPELFGSIKEAYTLRGFWAKFWHRLMRKAFVAVASSTLYDVVKVPRNVGRYLILPMVFLLSGLMHALLPGLEGPEECRKSSAIKTFLHYCYIAAAIVLEDVVMRIAKTLAMSLGVGYVLSPTGVWVWRWKVVGYCWVILFHIWAIPKLVLPNMLCNAGSDLYEASQILA